MIYFFQAEGRPMVEVYFYIPVKHAENAVECGLKLSEWYSKEVEIDGVKKKCISALLNPRDDSEKYMSVNFKCMKLEVMPKYCFIADNFLYKVGLTYPEVMDIYKKSMMPVEKYTFGRYRLPEGLVTNTVIGDYVKILDKRLDSPILFNSSEELYINNIIEGLNEKHSDFNDTMLYFFYCRLAHTGRITRIEDEKSGMAVFVDERDGTVNTIKIPDLSEY
jgi:hypothetical protein